jgi:hypothetical protein
MQALHYVCSVLTVAESTFGLPCTACWRLAYTTGLVLERSMKITELSVSDRNGFQVAWKQVA